MSKMQIASGFGQFAAIDFLNANFERISFEGQFGDYKLHFGGQLTHPVKVRLDISLGSLTILIPEDVPFRLGCDRTVFSSLDVQSAHEEADEYWYSDNYSENKPFINFDIDAGIGAVSLRVID